LNRRSVLACLPLLLLPGCWLYWWAGGLNPGVQPGRSAALLLVVGCFLAVRLTAVPRAALPLLLALAWQAASLAWTPVPELGLLWLVERCAAFTAALGCAWWLARDDGPHEAALAIAGLGILALTAATQTGLGVSLALGQEAPFGNVNFAVGAALPLVAIGLTRFLHGGGARWWVFALAAGGVGGLLAGGHLGGDPNRAIWLGGGVALATALVLRLPSRWQLPLIVGGAALLLAAWLAAIAGVGDPGRLGAGSAFRVHIWNAALEALAGPAAAIGHGTASAIAVLPEQPSFAAAWLSVPSYAEHAHSEPLQILLDGGLVLAGLLAWALWATIAPLWRRRGEAQAAALLAAWAAWAALALVESHLATPGGLLGTALLAAVSWRSGDTRILPSPRLSWLAVLPALMLAALIGRELAGDGGNATSIETRAAHRLENATGETRLAEFTRLRERLGPLDQVDLQRARALGMSGQRQEAAACLAGHLDRLPVDAEALRLAARMRLAGAGSPDLAAAEARARQRATALLAAIPENPVNRAARGALTAALAADDPAPAP